MSEVIGYTSGIFDLFHIGHLNVLRRASAQCDRLVVGVLDDEASLHKGYPPVAPLDERMDIVSAMVGVDEVIVDHTLAKLDAWQQVGFHRMFKGDDWKGTPRGDQWERDFRPLGVEVVWLPRTKGVSSSERRAIIERLAAEA